MFFLSITGSTKPGAVWVTQILLTVLALLPVGWLGYSFLRNWRIDNLYQASVVALSSGDLVAAWRTAHAHLMRLMMIVCLELFLTPLARWGTHKLFNGEKS